MHAISETPRTKERKYCVYIYVATNVYAIFLIPIR